jgi:hypothetical protein
MDQYVVRNFKGSGSAKSKALIILGMSSLMVGQVEPNTHVESTLDEPENRPLASCYGLTKRCYEIVKKPLCIAL